MLFKGHNTVTTLRQLMKRSPGKSSTCLTPYVVIAMLSTALPLLLFTAPWLFVTGRLHFLTPAPFSSSAPLPSGTHQKLSASVSLCLFCLFIYFAFLDSTCK